MTKKKMCTNWDKGDCTICPKNTNGYCEIVKPKARYKRVRAWGWVEDGAIKAYRLLPNKMTTPDFDKILGTQTYTPITILIDRKYLGDK